jgi:ribose transport system permease protein
MVMTAPEPTAPLSPHRARRLVDVVASKDQAYVVTGLLVLVTLVCSVLLDGFSTFDNLKSIALASAVLVIVSVGAATVIIGGGIDLSVIVIFGIGAQFAVVYMSHGHSEASALFFAALLCTGLGLLNGVIVAYLEIPPLFVTLATGLLYRGVAKLTYLEVLSGVVPDKAKITLGLGRWKVLGVQAPVIIAVVVVIVGHLILSRVAGGRSVRAMGDNAASARILGLPTRPLIVGTYVFSALMAGLAGVVQVGIVGSFDSRTYTTGSLLYDVLAVVVIGGVSLAGGRGSLGGVLAAALIIGVLLNAMTRANLDTIQQAICKSVLVLAALVLDSWLHPRSEETSRAGEL